MYAVVIMPRAARDLKKLRRDVLEKIDRILLSLETNPRPHGVRALSERTAADYRVRVGDYRILLDIDDTKRVVVIFRIGHRKDVYR